jgi:hypothetical protein
VPDLASFRTGAWITNIIAAIMVVSLAIFTAAFGYILIQALINTPFDLSLSQGVSNFSFSFFVYGFVSIECVFAAVVIFFGYSTVRTAIRRKILEIEID